MAYFVFGGRITYVFLFRDKAARIRRREKISLGQYPFFLPVKHPHISEEAKQWLVLVPSKSVPFKNHLLWGEKGLMKFPDNRS